MNHKKKFEQSLRGSSRNIGWVDMEWLLKMGIILKFTRTNLCLIKMDYLYTIQVLLYLSTLKLNLLLWLEIVNLSNEGLLKVSLTQKVGKKFWWVSSTFQLFPTRIYAKCFQITNETMAPPKLKVTQMKFHWTYLSCISKIKWWKTRTFTDLSNQIRWFLMASIMWNFVVYTRVFNYFFCKLQQKYFD